MMNLDKFKYCDNFGIAMYLLSFRYGTFLNCWSHHVIEIAE